MALQRPFTLFYTPTIGNLPYGEDISQDQKRGRRLCIRARAEPVPNCVVH